MVKIGNQFVKRQNLYDMESGERSVFDSEFDGTRDEAFAPALLQLHLAYPSSAHAIFGRIDWLAYLTHLVTASASQPQPQLAALLRLVAELNVAVDERNRAADAHAARAEAEAAAYLATLPAA